MDDYNINSLYESQNEWVARLVNIITPEIITGFREMLRESIKLCKINNEESKYLMTLQNFMSRVPKWNENMIQTETNRIIEDSGCNYLEDLISCVHIIQLKCLSCIRVGQKQKKIDIDIPSLNLFIHQVYINSARKLYKNIYLFEQNISPLDFQRNQNMLEIMIKESIVNTVRDNIPVDNLLRVYLDDQEEDEIIINEEIVEEKEEQLPFNNVNTDISTTSNNNNNNNNNNNQIQSNTEPEYNTNIDDTIELEPITLNVSLDDTDNNNNYQKHHLNFQDSTNSSRLKFSNIDRSLNENNIEEEIRAPKDIEHLEKISDKRYMERLELEAQEVVDDEIDRIQIQNGDILNIDSLGIIETL